MSQSLRELALLLGPKFRGLFRLFGRGELRHPLRLLFFAALAGLFIWAIYAGSAWFLHYVMQVELVGALIPRKLMSLVLLILISILLVSTTISSFSVFFLSDDLGLLMSAPVPIGSLYYARFVEMVGYSSWMVLLFGLPVFLAFGKVYAAGPGYYLALAGLFPALILIPGALGSIIAALLTRLFSARRSRDLIVILVVLGFVLLYLLIRAMKPERLLDGDSFGTMMEFLDMFRAPESSFLPTQWMTDFLFPLLEGRHPHSWLPALGVWGTAAAGVAISGWVGTPLYRAAYDRAQQGRIRAADRPGRGRLLGRWLDRCGVGLTGTLLAKELRLFMRDTNQWLQLVLLGALAAVYVLNFAYLRLAEFSWFVLYTVNHVMLGLVLAGVAVRFVFPAVSLEGRAWWIVRSAPVSLSAFLHAKLLIHLVPLALMGLGLSMLSCWIIGVPLAFGAFSAALVLSLSLSVSAMGVGIGALFPRFTVENPAKIPTGIGGVSFMIASMSYVLVFLLASVYPTMVLYRLPQRSVVHPGWLASSVGVMVVLAVLGPWVPMALGLRKLGRRED
ncbi:MAG: hypothetical protein JXR96_12470 [Deltaproteobacteria bacterium]|nr:hypothetical protein [Deltaproteobacteria bacterium]